MKHASFLLLLCAFLFVSVSCSDDDDNPTGSGSLEFKDQVLSGKIDGEDFTFVIGRAERATFPEGEYRFELTSVGSSSICDEFFLDGNQVIFTLPLATGVVTLSNDNSVTLLEGDDLLNIIATQGKIEIQNIDTDNNTITGRLVAHFDNDSSVNGNFTITLCD